MANPVNPDEEAAKDKAELDALIAGVGRGSSGFTDTENAPEMQGARAAPKPGAGFAKNVLGTTEPPDMSGQEEAAARVASGARGFLNANVPPKAAQPPSPLGSVRGTLKQQGPDMSKLGGTIGGIPAPAPQAKPPPMQLAPTPGGGSKPVINLPKGAGQVPATATMFLFIGLALLTMWPYVVKPLVQRAATGQVTVVAMPPSSIISLLLFGVVLIFISELGPTAASFTALLMLGLWAVLLIMHPEIVTTFASWVSQSNKQAETTKQSQSQQTGKKGA